MASKRAAKVPQPPAKTPAARKKAAGAAVPAPKTRKKPATPVKKAKAPPRPPVASVPTPTPEPASIKLEPRQERFVQEYLIDLNATQAAIRAGYSDKTASVIGCENLTKPNVAAAIAQAQKERADRTAIKADQALLEAWRIATADARELVQVKVGCCRHCYGEGHRYQRTVGEFNAAREAHAKEGKPPEDFDEKGGIGYDSLKAPLADCPECRGDGQPRVVLADTRHLSPAAVALYAGAKEGKHGIEVQFHDKQAALEKVFKHLGLYKEDNSQKLDPLASLLKTITSGSSSAFMPVAKDPERDEG